MSPKSPSPAASTATRQTSDRVSTGASYLMRALQEFGARVELFVYVRAKNTKSGFRAKRADVTDIVESVAASALNQDQTKGLRFPPGKWTPELIAKFNAADASALRFAKAGERAGKKVKMKRPVKRKRGKGKR